MITKEKITISLNKTINDKLNMYCETNFTNKSKLINYLVESFLKNNLKK